MCVWETAYGDRLVLALGLVPDTKVETNAERLQGYLSYTNSQSGFRAQAHRWPLPHFHPISSLQTYCQMTCPHSYLKVIFLADWLFSKTRVKFIFMEFNDVH